LLLGLKFHGTVDRFRSKRAFSSDIAAVNAVLFSDRYKKREKIRVYREWLERGQPCVFGKVAAKNKNVFICLLEEREILGMRRGDDDLRDTIQEYRQAWKRHALEGLSSSFLIVLVSPAVVDKEPNHELKELCRRLMELYMELEHIEDDAFHGQREFLYLRTVLEKKTRLLKFSTLPNVFCAQGDGRWWHDHRTPGGIMITSNALGHFTYARGNKTGLTDRDKVQALQQAMQTIKNAYVGPAKPARPYKHCPATSLVPAAVDLPSPLPTSSNFCAYSPDRYRGFFHTDHLIPSVFFQKEKDPAGLTSYEDLSLRYIWDDAAEPEDHRDLMTGDPATWYDVRRNMDRLPDWVDPETTPTYTVQLRAQLGSWLEQRLRDRQRMTSATTGACVRSF
jgi:hypothetical protein